MTPQQWRSAALAALWALVVASGGLTAFVLWKAQPITEFTALTAFRSLLAALVLVWWTQVFSAYSAAQDTPETSGVLRALRAVFPWLTALRLALWMLSLLALSSGGAAEVNPVVITSILTIELGFILAKNAMYGTLARLAPTPADEPGRLRLMGWLNTAAALSLALGVVNVVPVAGLGGERDLSTTAFYGVHAALDVLALVLALKAVQARANEGQEP